MKHHIGNIKGIIALATLGITCIAVYVYASSRMFLPTWQQTPGTKSGCSGDGTGHFGNNGPYDRHLGTGTFLWTSNDSYPSSQLSADALSFTATDPTLGDFQVNLDKSRPVTSEIRAVTPGTDFPANSTLKFHATITFDNQPGKTYRTMDGTPVVLNNPALNHWPHDHDTYLQVGTADVEDDANRGTVTETINNLSVTLTAQ